MGFSDPKDRESILDAVKNIKEELPAGIHTSFPPSSTYLVINLSYSTPAVFFRGTQFVSNRSKGCNSSKEMGSENLAEHVELRFW